MDMHHIRKSFPILDQKVNGKELIYFDNAATTQKPYEVIEALTAYYSGYNANIHRGIHHLAEKATAAFEATRDTAREFLNATSREEIIFTKGVTEGINLIASSYGRKFLKPGDEIIISGMEHHSNIVPWQLIAEEVGAKLKIIPITDQGEIIFEEYLNLLTDRTKIVSIVHVSNALGTINPVKDIIDKAHGVGAVVVLDGAQSSSHLDIDVQALDCDFFVFSGHKVYGPTGIGILYGKRKWLEAMPPYQSGGEMIKEVSFEGTTFNELPYKFEAGTPNIADAIALKAALDFIGFVGKSTIRAKEDELVSFTTALLSEIDGLRIVGQAKEKVSVVSFVIDGIHPQDMGILLDGEGIAVRTGHHCTQPLMKRLGIPGTTRASFAVYNTKEEVERFLTGVRKAVKMLR
ncbi:MAG: cysteine desulfurase [Cytophagales bacterium]|nr:cysteine desulfurase [Cytophagales bacterium]